MKPLSALVLAFFYALILGACGGSGNEPEVNTKPTPNYGGERLISKSHEAKPQWVYKMPANTQNQLWFVGVSTFHATEQDARDGAMRHSAEQFVQYLGRFVDVNYEQASLSYGLASGISDPTVARKEFMKDLSTGIAKYMTADEYYIEEWQKADGRGYQARVLAFIGANDQGEPPAEVVQEAAADQRRRAEQAQKDANTQQAKKQAQNAADFWAQLEQQGLPVN